MQVRAKELLTVLLTAAILSIALTWPIAARFGSAGRIDSGDGRYSVWNVAWVAHALTTAPSELYNANIFFPHDKTLALSEANLFAGTIAIPVWLLTQNPHAASNWTILCSFVLSAVAMYVLVRRLSGSIVGAGLAAVSFAYCPFVFSHIPHVQLLMTFGLPLVLLAMHAFVSAPTVGRALWLGAAMALQALASGYYGIFGGLTAGLCVVWFGFTFNRWRDWRYWGLAVLAAGFAVVIVAPFFAPYLEIQQAGFGRSLDDARVYSVRWRSYFVSPMLVHRWMLSIIRAVGGWREVLFPGFIPLGLAAVAVVRTFGRRQSTVPVPRAIVGFYLILGALALWASLGPDAGLYAALHHSLPVFSMLRAPARFGLLVTLSAAVLGGLGLASLLPTLADGRRRRLAAIVLLLTAGSSTVGALRLADAPELPPAYQRLISLPPGPVAEFPFFIAPLERHRHTEYMLMSTYHWKPLINGSSDHMPEDFFREAQQLATFPDVAAWRVLRDRQARYVVIHWEIDEQVHSAEHRRALELEIPQLQNYLRVIVDSTRVSLYEIISWPEGTQQGS